jgi:DNA-directed RNA polymerase sigma subunit (sigma70/sigma32)
MNNFDFNKRMQKLIDIRDRNNEMNRLRWNEKWTLEKIGKKYKLTRSRVLQIVGKVTDNER